MSISMAEFFEACVQSKIPMNGVLHIGAHLCGEKGVYQNFGISLENVDWIEADESIANRAKEQNIPNIHIFAVDDEEGEADFFVTNNEQSSSLLVLGTHKESYPYIYVTETKKVQKKRLATFFKELGPEYPQRNIWVLDIQGSELNALKSADDYLDSVDAIISEVNTAFVYEKCSLLEEMDSFLKMKGFTRTLTSVNEYHWGDAMWIKNKFISE